ncbi:unnamed protein product [Ophioblennius macclurei]
MTSRRPMTRSFSGNGRTSSFSEEDGSNGRSETRNTYLSNVRPENRSTLCSVMAQLTEDIQPSFETTLKSKAVSENCNVKFTCVVSGYPPPELKWYKDDMEMDRYCGLPKYEIRKNGKTHTLHIYNCTLDDAAIYQVSASNSKGIVSCSGVLEVGTMSEFQIHQRFFAKLKQKAEKKKRDSEVQTKKEDKENVTSEKPQSSPEPPPRKRFVPPREERRLVKEPASVEPPGAAGETNGISSRVEETAPVASKDSCLQEKATPPEETLEKKRIKMSNGIDSNVKNSSTSSNKNQVMGNGSENCYDGGMSLAQFLSETLQSQSAEDKQTSPQVEKPAEMDTNIINCITETDNDKEKMRKKKELEKTLQEEYEKEKKREQELFIEKERERERQVVAFHTAHHGKHAPESKHHNKGPKDHDHHNIHASISSMFHSVKDFLFGKGKKEHHGSRNSLSDNEDRHHDHPPAAVRATPPETPPSFRLQPQRHAQASTPSTEEVVPMEVDQPSDSVDTVQPSGSLQPIKSPREDLVLHAESASVETDDAAKAAPVSAEPENTCTNEEASPPVTQVLTETKEKHSEAVSPIEDSPTHQKSRSHEDSPQTTSQVLSNASPPWKDKAVFPETPAQDDEATLTSLEDNTPPPQSMIVAAESFSVGKVTTETLHKEEIGVDHSNKNCESDTEERLSSNKLRGEEKAEVKSNKQVLSDVNRSRPTRLNQSTISQEDQSEPTESETSNEVLFPPSGVEASRVNGDCVDEGTVASPESLELGDLKTQLHKVSDSSEEITEHLNVEAQSSNSPESVDESEKVQSGASVKEFKGNVSNSVEKEELVHEGSKSVEVRIECLQTKDKNGPAEKVEDLNDSNIHSVKLNNEDSANDLEESSSNPHQEHLGSLENRPSENIPTVHIPAVDKSSDNKPVEPSFTPKDHFIIPKIEIMEPEFKECTLPLTILTKNQQEPTYLQKRDATHVSAIINQEQSVAESPNVFPTQKNMQSDDHLPPPQSMKESVQSDETEKPERVDPHGKSSKQLPQLDFASIPIINVSCTDDKEDESSGSTNMPNTHQNFDSVNMPRFVVPPISITCHESEPEVKPPTHSEKTETESSDGMQQGANPDVGHTVAKKPEKTQTRKQDFEEMSENVLKENTPTALCDITIQKVGDSAPSVPQKTEEIAVPEVLKPKPVKDARVENSALIEDLQKNRGSVERLTSKPPAYPALSPSSLRKFMSKAAPDSDGEAVTNAPGTSDKADEDLSGGSTPTSSLSCESSPRMKRRDSLTLIRSATPEELASGARRKIFMPKAKDDAEASVFGVLDPQGKKESSYMSPSQARRAALLQAGTGQNTPPMERRSPLLSRRKATLEVPKVVEEPPVEEPASNKREEKPAEKKLDPLKAPQVIRKIRGEPFPDASGHLKLWCQFFNVLSDSTIKWFKEEEEILELKRSGGDEGQVALAIVMASSQDCGVYGCTISNEYGTDTTDFLLSTDVLSDILLKDELEVGEEIEMTPMVFSKGLGDSGSWGDKYFGRIITETVHMGEGYAHKTSKAKVIYGLDPVFESGTTCIIKVQNPIAYGTKNEKSLSERNQDITKQECKVQNMIREYCKIFAAEARVNENFGFSLEVTPRYLMYRPANSVPYATVEADLTGDYLKYAWMDPQGKLLTQNVSEVEQKCSTFQHWIHQWTHGNLLVTQLEGVETKITNIRVVTKSKGYQGLTERGSPEVFEQFLTQHQCNYYCGLLGLRPLKSMDSLQQSSKIKGSRSPLLNRKLGSNSPQLQRKGQSPQMSRKANTSPKVSRKTQETDESKAKAKPTETPEALEMR